MRFLAWFTLAWMVPACGMHIVSICRNNKGATNLIGLVGSIGIGALAILYLMGY